MKEETYIEILNICTSKTDSRLWLRSPFNVSDRTMATNAHILVAVPRVGDYPYTPSTKVEDAYPFEKTMRVPIAVSKFKTELAKYPVGSIYNHTSCDACDGSGKVEWNFEYEGKEYTEDNDCPVCQGQGCHSVKTDKIEIDEDAYFKLGQSVFRIEVISKLLKIAELAGAEEVGIVSQGELQGSVFEIGEIEVLIMPCGLYDDDIIGLIEIDD